MSVAFANRVSISKIDRERRIAYGWAYVTHREDGSRVTDHSKQRVSLEELDKAADEFMEFCRVGGEMHERRAGYIVHSLVITDEIAAALGIQSKKRGWFIGFKVTDDDAWEGVKSGRYRMFSIAGTAQVVPITEGAAA